MKKMPIIENKVTMSKNGRFLIHRTNKLTIERKDNKMKYLKGVWKNGNTADVIDGDRE